MNSFLFTLPCFALCLCLCAPAAAKADPRANSSSFTSALKLQNSGKINQAIEMYETLADQGVMNASLSFNRGLAYAQRGSSETKIGHQSSDLGQAVAALREAQMLSENKELGKESLKTITESITQKLGASKGRVLELIPLQLRLLRALSSQWLFYIAALSSLLTTLFVFFELHQSSLVKLRARIAAGFSGTMLLLSVALCSLRLHLASDDQPAVVTASRAVILSESGRTISGMAPLNQGTLVYEEMRLGRLVKIAEVNGEGMWVQSTHLRSLMTRRP